MTQNRPKNITTNKYDKKFQKIKIKILNGYAYVGKISCFF